MHYKVRHTLGEKNIYSLILHLRIGGYLVAMGYGIHESRIHDSLRRVDPVGITNRWIHGICRRPYSVPSPNALWHMDGNHNVV